MGLSGKIKTFIYLTLAAILVYCLYLGSLAFRKSQENSVYQDAMVELGFKGFDKGQDRVQAITQHQSLLNILNMSGYLKPENVWRDLHALKIDDAAEKFKVINLSLINSGANTENFNSKILAKNFLSGALTTEEAKQFIIYVTQHAFGREKGQERVEITDDAMISSKKNIFIKNAKNLQLIRSKQPLHKEYYVGWVCGASRPRFMKRAIDYKNNVKNFGLKILNGEYALTGQRELFAELDGMNPEYAQMLKVANSTGQDLRTIETRNMTILVTEGRAREGKNYLERLAKKNNILLSKRKFIKYKKGDLIPSGRLAGRTYVDYANMSQKMISETMMVRDVLSELKVEGIKITDTPAEGGGRPNTQTTTRAASKILANLVKDDSNAPKDIRVIYQSNAPYMIYQAEIAQLEADKAFYKAGLTQQGYKAHIDYMGPKAAIGAPVIYSQLASLIYNRWKFSYYDISTDKFNTPRSSDELLYTKRERDPKVPELTKAALNPMHKSLKEKIFGTFKNYFDGNI